MNRAPSIALLRALACALVAAAGLASTASRAADAEFLDPQDAFRGSARVVAADAIELRIDIAPGYHLYRERIAITAEGASLAAVDLPRGRVQFDTNLGQSVEVLEGALRMRVAVIKAPDAFRVRATYQGCADRGLCYPPESAEIVAGAKGGVLQNAAWQNDGSTSREPAAPSGIPSPPPTVATTALPTADSGAALPGDGGSAAGRVGSALRSGRLATIAAVFVVAGLLLSFTPCVLPMIPILSSIIVGAGTPVSRRRGFTLALAYSLGMAVVYTALGIAAGLLGEGLAAALQNPWVLGAFALILATLAVSMFGAFTVQMPGFVQSRLSAGSGRLAGGRHAAVFAMGGLSALILGPCVAAPLAGALIFISQTRDVIVGGVALFSLAIGMSVPLLLVGLSAGTLLPRAGAWMNHVKTFFGVLLLGVALWLVAPVLPVPATMAIIGIGLLLAAACLDPFAPVASVAGRSRGLRAGAALVLAVFGVTQVVGALSGGSSVTQPLRQFAADRDAAPGREPTPRAFQRIRSVAELEAALRGAGRPVMLDFYADWCVSCKEMEHLTFSDATVRPRMQNALLLQADVSANSDADRALLKRFRLFGPPGIVFFDDTGREREEARVIGFVPAPKFVESLALAGL